MIWQYVLILVILIVISLVIVKIRKEDFHIEINKLIQYLGGKDNIIDVQMNLSRLKVTVKDTTLVNKEGIQKLGAKGIVEIDNELKIILGPNSKQIKKYMTDLNSLKESEIDEIEKKIITTPHIMNGYLISLETMSLKDSTMKVLYILSTIVIIIIIVSSVFCIKNSFDISITEKTKQYGMFRSIGATSKQIKKNVLNEAYILWLIGAPVGILCGIFAAFVLIKVSNHFLGNLLVFGALIFKTSILAIVLSIILSFITIYFSALKIARRASKLSPMSAIRSQDDIKIKSKKISSPKYIQKLYYYLQLLLLTIKDVNEFRF